MTKNAKGIIFKTNLGDYAIAYNHEQLPIFTDKDKLLCHIFIDEEMKNKKLDKPMLKDKKNLTPIGYIN